MPKPSLDEVLNVGDPMLNDNFDLVFTRVPAAVTTVRCACNVSPA